MTEVVAVTTMRDYFRDAVKSALIAQALSPSGETSAYLVELLCEYARQQPDLEGPLSWSVAAAEAHPKEESIQRLKEAGDTSLYVAGYFHESLPRLQLDTDYFIEVGGAAYLKLSHLLEIPQNSTRLVVVFSELGSQFARFVHVLKDVRRLAD